MPGHLQFEQALADLDCSNCHSNRGPHRGQNCAACHEVLTWLITSFRHPSAKSTDCSQCHQTPPSQLLYGALPHSLSDGRPSKLHERPSAHLKTALCGQRRPQMCWISDYFRLAVAVRSNLPVTTKEALHQLEPNPAGLIAVKSPVNLAVWSLVKALQSPLFRSVS
jgi:hypothetical protein